SACRRSSATCAWRKGRGGASRSSWRSRSASRRSASCCRSAARTSTSPCSRRRTPTCTRPRPQRPLPRLNRRTKCDESRHPLSQNSKLNRREERSVGKNHLILAWNKTGVTRRVISLQRPHQEVDVRVQLQVLERRLVSVQFHEKAAKG